MHVHLLLLPSNLRRRMLSVQPNAGSTGDPTWFHGRLWPDQQHLTPADGGCYLCPHLLVKQDRKAVFDGWKLKVMGKYMSVYTGEPVSVPPPPKPGPTPAPPTPTTRSVCVRCRREGGEQPLPLVLPEDLPLPGHQGPPRKPQHVLRLHGTA